MRRTTTAEVRPDAGGATRFSASARSTGGFDRLPCTRTRFGVAQDARRDDPGLATTRNRGNVGSKTCLVHFDNNKYSVNSRAVGRPVEIQAYADRVVIRQDGAIVGEHRRRFGRGETIHGLKLVQDALRCSAAC